MGSEVSLRRMFCTNSKAGQKHLATVVASTREDATGRRVKFTPKLMLLVPIITMTNQTCRRLDILHMALHTGRGSALHEIGGEQCTAQNDTCHVPKRALRPVQL